jgi:hypothetical protein
MRVETWVDTTNSQKNPFNHGLKIFLGGETGIRTPDRLLTYTRFPGVRLKPLIHLSGGESNYSKLRALRDTHAQTRLRMPDVVHQRPRISIRFPVHQTHADRHQKSRGHAEHA